MRKRHTEYNQIKERIKKYGCDGFCYGGIDEQGIEHNVCGCIDICDETRVGEFWATVFAVFTIILIPIAVIATFCFAIYHCITTGGGL